MLGDLYKILKMHNEFEIGGWFSKKVSLNYNAVSDQPWLHFECSDDDKFSFDIHELEMKGEGFLWHLGVQNKESVEFKGYSDLGKLRGYLCMPNKNYRLGLVVRKGRVEKLVSQKEIEDIFGKLNFPMVVFNKE